VARAVTVVDLGQAAVHQNLLAVGAGGHIAEGQRVGQRLRRRASWRSSSSARTSRPARPQPGVRRAAAARVIPSAARLRPREASPSR
jgi:hypothetical protein